MVDIKFWYIISFGGQKKKDKIIHCSDLSSSLWAMKMFTFSNSLALSFLLKILFSLRRTVPTCYSGSHCIQLYSFGLSWFPLASWSLTVFHNTLTNVWPWLQVYSYGLRWLAIAS